MKFLIETDSHDEFRHYYAGQHYHFAITDFKEWLRKNIKYSPDKELKEATDLVDILEVVREKFFTFIEERLEDLHSDY